MTIYKKSKKKETFFSFFKDLVLSERRFSILLVKVLKWQTGQSFLSTLIELLKMKFLKQRGKRGTEHLPWIIDLKLENWIFLYFLAALKNWPLKWKQLGKKSLKETRFIENCKRIQLVDQLNQMIGSYLKKNVFK